MAGKIYKQLLRIHKKPIFLAVLAIPIVVLIGIILFLFVHKHNDQKTNEQFSRDDCRVVVNESKQKFVDLNYPEAYKILTDNRAKCEKKFPEKIDQLNDDEKDSYVIAYQYKAALSCADFATGKKDESKKAALAALDFRKPITPEMYSRNPNAARYVYDLNALKDGIYSEPRNMLVTKP